MKEPAAPPSMKWALGPAVRTVLKFSTHLLHLCCIVFKGELKGNEPSRAQGSCVILLLGFSCLINPVAPWRSRSF